MPGQTMTDFLSRNSALILVAVLIFVVVLMAVRIVPQSEKYVVERFGRLRAVLGPGINFIVPFVDRVKHKISILERQLPTARQDAITADNVLVQVETSVFYRILEPEKTVYRICDCGCGAAHLSFALYHYLNQVRGWPVVLTGVPPGSPLRSS